MATGKKPSKEAGRLDALRDLAAKFPDLSERILSCTDLGTHRVDLLRDVSEMLVEFSRCDAVELWLKEGAGFFVCQTTRSPEGRLHFQIVRPDAQTEGPEIVPGRSLAAVPLTVGNENIGLLHLKSRHRARPMEDERKWYENVARILAAALVNQRAQAALRERVKELTCLFGIAQVAERPGASPQEVLQGIVGLLPPAWQYPEVAAARIVLDGRSYATAGFGKGRERRSAEIVVDGSPRGLVEVVYTKPRPEVDEGPFLKEERHLIDGVARQVASIIERRRVELERSQLHEQLMHADRLATIGQLAAGVAHELNEPLGNILGFAQLAQKAPKLPRQAGQDIGKIERAALHAREITRKLLLFARQMPARREPVDLNQVVEDGLYFLEARCVRAGIELERSLSPDLPEMVGDPALLNQVLVNLVVNAVQAMPEGGRLRVATRASKSAVWLTVEDTGTGMSKEVMKQIFVPFFTTKDVGQGTGLGLPVVHGIVSSHDGSINVESRVGQGARFEIRLPLDRSQESEENGSDGPFRQKRTNPRRG